MLASWKERFVLVGAPNFVAGSSMIGYFSLLTARLLVRLEIDKRGNPSQVRKLSVYQYI